MIFSLGQPPNKKFSEDIKFFHTKLQYNVNFSFSKFADGEWAVMTNNTIDNSEFMFDQEKDQHKREKLLESFQYQNPQYYVGISCPCCQGDEVFSDMKKVCGQKSDMLTWANLWVNKNYKYFTANILPIFSSRKTVLYCNGEGDIDSLPFSPDKVFPISKNAWEHDWDLIEESKKYIKDNNIKDYLFLFCCGPFGNILCHELTEFDQNNTYLDIGSTLNPYLKSEGFQRDYYMGNTFFANMECTWGK
tara:strand:+ start:315 stop:1055 length:741 start_codon:yes stop_codon:yes gene_type:complete